MIEARGSTPAGETADVRSAAALSLGHATVMVLGGVLALLIAQIFGRSARTDAFFAAYGFYAIALVFGQAFRLTAMPTLLAARDRDETADRLLAAVVLIALLAAVPMIALAVPLSALLVEEDPGSVASDSLRLLWPALAGNLIAGILGTFLAVRGAFGTIALGYVMAGSLSILVFLALEDAVGIESVPIALGASACALTALLAFTLVRLRWRPSLSRLRAGAVAGEGVRLALGSASFVTPNLAYLICLAVASRDGAGEATLYAYAFFAAALLVAVTAFSAAIVRTPKLLTESGTEGIPVANALSTYRFSVMLIAPALGFVAVAGPPLIGFALGDAFDGDEAERLVVTMLALSGWTLASAAGVLAVIDLLRRGRIGALATIAAVQLAVLPLLAIAGRAAGGIELIAAAQSLAMIGATLAQLRLAFGDRAGAAVRSMLAATARAALVAAVAFGPGLALVLAGDRSAPATLVATATGLALTVIASFVAWPRETRTLLSLLSDRSG